MVTYSQRLSAGFVFRDKDGSRPAQFPPEWMIKREKPGEPFCDEEVNKRASEQ